MNITASNSFHICGMTIIPAGVKMTHIETSKVKTVKSSVVLKTVPIHAVMLERVNRSIYSLEYRYQQLEAFVIDYEDQIDDDMFEYMLSRGNEMIGLLDSTRIVIESIAASKKVLMHAYIAHVLALIDVAHESAKSMNQVLDAGLARYV